MLGEVEPGAGQVEQRAGLVELRARPAPALAKLPLRGRGAVPLLGLASVRAPSPRVPPRPPWVRRNLSLHVRPQLSLQIQTRRNLSTQVRSYLSLKDIFLRLK